MANTSRVALNTPLNTENFEEDSKNLKTSHFKEFESTAHLEEQCSSDNES